MAHCVAVQALQIIEAVATDRVVVGFAVLGRLQVRPGGALLDWPADPVHQLACHCAGARSLHRRALRDHAPVTCRLPGTGVGADEPRSRPMHCSAVRPAHWSSLKASWSRRRLTSGRLYAISLEQESVPSSSDSWYVCTHSSDCQDLADPRLCTLLESALPNGQHRRTHTQ